MVDVSKKFVYQIEKIFAHPKVDIDFVNERLEKAYDHFYIQLDNLIYSVLKRRLMVSRIKKTKEFQEELAELDDKQIDVILQLKRIKNLFHAIVSGKEITKNDLMTSDIQEYRRSKLVKIQDELIASKNTIDFDFVKEDDERSVNKILEVKKEKKSPKKEKTPTHLITKELFQAGKTVEEIAAERVLTTNTIESHLAKLIATNEIEVFDVMSKEKLEELKSFFQKNGKLNDISLSEMKERAGGSFSWGELRIFRATLVQE